MKKIIFLFIIVFTTISQAQMRNGQRQIAQPQQEPPKPNFEVEKYVGIVTYNIKKAAKKSSIKLSSKEGKEFSTILTKYNKEINDIKKINTFLLKSTKEMVEDFQKKSEKSGDFSNHLKVLKKMKENLKPIHEIIKKENKKLDKVIKNLLSIKQYKKWDKYNRKINKVLFKK